MTITGLLTAFVAGALFGSLYLSLLWLAVSRLAPTGRLGLFAAATLGRFVLVLAVLYGFFVLAHGTAAELSAALLGLVLVRFPATRFYSRPSGGR